MYIWAFRIPVNLTEAVFVTAMVGLGSVIPASTGNFGPFEYFCSLSLMLLGIAPANALGFSLFLHGNIFLSASVLGLLLMFRFGLDSVKEVHEQHT